MYVKRLGLKIFIAQGDYEGRDVREIPEADTVYVTEGQIFEVVDYIRRNCFDAYIKKMLFKSATYIGASAGAIYASAF